MSVKAIAQWDVNEITLDVVGTNVILFEPARTDRFTNGMVSKAQVCMTIKEARTLLSTLHSAINTYDELDKASETL